jgi:hypothetical protein
MTTVNPFLPKKDFIEVTEYYEPENKGHRGNPLITFIPPLNPEILNKIMRSDVKVDIKKRNEPEHLRIQYLMELKLLYWPQAPHLDWAWKLWSLICQGYAARNPARASAAARFHELRQSLATGEPKTDDAACFLDSEWCAVLIGTPGTGKSATSRALLDLLGPALFYHPAHGIFQALSVRVQASKNATGKGLALQVFHALAAYARKTGHYFPYSGKKPPSTLPELEDVIVELAKALNLGALVVDELQHLFRGSGAMDHEAMKFLTGLVNRLRHPIVLIATWKCLDLLTLEGRIMRRALSPALGYFRKMPNDGIWMQFFELLLLKQYVRKPTKDETGALRERLYYHCQGIHDVALKLWVIAQMEAIADESEELTPALLDRIGEMHVPILAPWIGHLQKGVPENNPTIYDAEPVDFDKYLESLRAQALIRAGRVRAAGRLAGVDPLVAYQVAQGLVAAEVTADPQAALQVATDAVKASPGTTSAEALERILKDSKPNGPRPTSSKNPQKRKKVADAFAALAKDDIRRIIFEAVQRQVKPADALREAGYLANILEDVSF